MWVSNRLRRGPRRLDTEPLSEHSPRHIHLHDSVDVELGSPASVDRVRGSGAVVTDATRGSSVVTGSVDIVKVFDTVVLLWYVYILFNVSNSTIYIHHS